MSTESDWRVAQVGGVRPVTPTTATRFERPQERSPQQGGDDDVTAAGLKSRELEQALARANLNLGPNTTLQFRVDDKTEKLVVSVVDRNSGEVLRQIPSEEMLALAEQLNESGRGLFDVKI
ncbi:MAG: hypothetical protein CMN28_16685 [Salinisphaeraceae bacterium]|jgi:flagellar protein FlaG|nr:hypothetical protein [Salinisphaeraceae bacterium]